MPRDFDSDALAGEPDRAAMALRFTENVDCPQCALVFEGVFHDDSDSVQDMTDPPVGEHVCPGCGHAFATEMTGWTFFSEAG